MKLRQLGSLIPLALLGLWAVPACGGNDSTGGPPEAPCTDAVKGSAPICGSACTVRCGCNTCADGDLRSVDGALYVCSGGCFVPDSSSGGATGGGGAPSGGGGSAGGGGTPSGGGTTSGGGAAGSGGFGLVGGNAGAGGT